MTTQALQMRDRWSVITLVEHDGPAPWEALFAWPRAGDAHVAIGDRATRNIFAARLDAAVGAARDPVLLVASGAACQAAAWWARLTPVDYVARVAGAMFFAPSDAADAREAFESPRIRLPFPSLVMPSAGDPVALQAASEDWGSRVMRAARRRAPTLAPTDAWRHAQRLIGTITARVVERDVATVGAAAPDRRGLLARMVIDGLIPSLRA